jgi:lysophospholipase L1-like esterase
MAKETTMVRPKFLLPHTNSLLPLLAMATFAIALLAADDNSLAHAQQTRQLQWIGTWATAPMTPSEAEEQRPFCDVTLREIAHLSVGGDRIRVRLTNEFGVSPLTVSAAHVALSAGGSAVQPGTDRVLTFDGQTSVQVPAGAILLSDPVKLDVPPFANVAVSLYLPTQYIRNDTVHSGAFQTNYLAQGNVVDSPSLAKAEEIGSWYFFDGVDVVSNYKNAGAIVVMGDSITDGAYSTDNANHRWPDFLARRLQENKQTAHLSVLNEGIGGNRLLNNGSGPDAPARFDRDVLSQSGVKYLIVLEGINDIGRLITPWQPSANIHTQQLELALAQMADRAHTAGIKIIGATMTPYGGAGYYTEKGEQIREEVNQWVRTSGVFDGVIDFDAATRDPKAPQKFLPLYDHGDHLHPSDAGYKAMGDAVDLDLFQK